MRRSIVLDSETLNYLSTEFSLGTIFSAKKIGGDANMNFKLVTSKGAFVVKLIKEYPLPELLHEGTYIKKLQKSNLPVTEYISTISGQLFIQKSNCIYTCQKWIEGVHPSKNSTTCFEIGKYLAKLHVIDISNVPIKSSWFSISKRNDFIMNSEKFDDKSIVEWFKNRGNATQKLFTLDLPTSIIHCDTHLENVLFSNNELIAWLDWEEATIGPSILDIGLSSIWLCFDENLHFKPDFFKVLIQSYQQIRPLTDLEFEHLSLAIEYALIAMCAWRIVRFGVDTYVKEELRIVYERKKIHFAEISSYCTKEFLES